MKHLKRIFESKFMIDTNYLGDMLQEISDIGYLSHVESNWWSDDRGNSIKITIYGKSGKAVGVSHGVSGDYIYLDEAMEVIERLISYLNSEGYLLDQPSDKKIQVIKQRPTTKTESEIKIETSKYSSVNMKWDDEISGYKIMGLLGLNFRG